MEVDVWVFVQIDKDSVLKNSVVEGVCCNDRNATNEAQGISLCLSLVGIVL